MDSSSFGNTPDLFSQAELLKTGGATCDCYRVKLWGRLHFLKRLKEELRTDPRYVVALQKEFETGYNLDHPHIVRYLSKGEDYILMEYVDGEQLSDFMTGHPDFFADKTHVNRFLSQLLAAVECLHQHGIVHLDLKPQNILITRIGRNVKLADLGFCYADAYPDTMGRTDRYAAPEQFRVGLLPDERTDIYAIGRIIEQFPCASNYSQVIDRCTAALPEQRYQSVQELQSDLQPKSKRRGIIITSCLAVTFLAAFYLLLPRMSAPIEDSQPIDSMPTSLPSDSSMALPMAVPAPAPSQALQEQPVSPAPTEKVSVTELRQRLRSVMQPIYASTLEPLTKLPYTGNERLYDTEAESFRSQLRNHLHPLGEELIKTDAIGERTFYTEWSNMEMDYLNSTYDKMQRNEKLPSGDGQE